MFLVLLTRLGQAHAECEDIDTQACELMAARQEDFCLNSDISFATCPRFCNLCRKYHFIPFYVVSFTMDSSSKAVGFVYKIILIFDNLQLLHFD